jgi:hypothetical protein
MTRPCGLTLSVPPSLRSAVPNRSRRSGQPPRLLSGNVLFQFRVRSYTEKRFGITRPSNSHCSSRRLGIDSGLLSGIRGNQQSVCRPLLA